MSDESKWHADRHFVVERSESDDLRQPVKPVLYAPDEETMTGTSLASGESRLGPDGSVDQMNRVRVQFVGAAEGRLTRPKLTSAMPK